MNKVLPFILGFIFGMIIGAILLDVDHKKQNNKPIQRTILFDTIVTRHYITLPYHGRITELPTIPTDSLNDHCIIEGTIATQQRGYTSNAVYLKQLKEYILKDTL